MSIVSKLQTITDLSEVVVEVVEAHIDQEAELDF